MAFKLIRSQRAPHPAELLAEFVAEFTHLLADVTQGSCHHRHCDLRAAKLEGGKSLIHTRQIESDGEAL